jgi:hypothetical protein
VAPTNDPAAEVVAVALAAHAARQRAIAAALRARATSVLERAASYASHHSHPTMEGFRRQVETDARLEADRLTALADRAELRAARAAVGLLLHAPPENADPDYLGPKQSGQYLLKLGRAAGIVVTE